MAVSPFGTCESTRILRAQEQMLYKERLKELPCYPGREGEGEIVKLFWLIY